MGSMLRSLSTQTDAGGSSGVRLECGLPGSAAAEVSGVGCRRYGARCWLSAAVDTHARAGWAVGAGDRDRRVLTALLCWGLAGVAWGGGGRGGSSRRGGASGLRAPRRRAGRAGRAGTGAVAGAWLLLGRRRARVGMRWLAGTAVLWAVPVLPGPPLASRDLYA